MLDEKQLIEKKKGRGGAENNDIHEVNLPKMTHNQSYVSVIRINPLQNTFGTVR